MNVPFLLFFYDAGNLNGTIYSASYLQLGLNPFAHGSNVLGGYPLEPYYYFTWVAYRASGFDPFWAALAVKLLAVAATYLAGMILYRLARKVRPGTERVLLFAFLLNPVLLFVNDVWMESDVFVILGLFIALDLLWARPDPAPRTRRTLYGTAALVWTIVCYYSTAILVPSFFIFRRSPAARLRFLIALVLWGAVFAIPIVAFGLLSSGTMHFVQGTGSSWLSILDLFLPATIYQGAAVPNGLQLDTLIVAGVLALTVPLLFARWRLSLPVAQLVVYAAVNVLAFSFVQGDNIVLFLPFLYLSLLTIPSVRVTYLNLLLVQLFFVPEIAVVMMFDGPGYASGFYYWGYYLFHRNVFLAQVLGAGVWQVCLGVYYGGLIATVAILVWCAWRAREPTAPLSGPAEIQPALDLPARRTTRTRIALTVGLVLLLLAPVGAGMVAVSSGRLVVSDGFPSYLFTAFNPASPHLSYALPSNQTYLVKPDDRTIQFPAGGTEVSFVRELSSSVTSVNLSASLPQPSQLPTGKEVTFFTVNGFSSSFATLENLTPNDTRMAPNVTANATLQTVSTTVILGPTPGYSLRSSGVVLYQNSLGQLANRSWFWGEFMGANGTGASSLWSMTVDNWSISASENDHNFSLSGRSATTDSTFNVSTSADFGPSTWILTGISGGANGHSLSAFLNGAVLTVPETLAGVFNLRVGGGSNMAPGPNPPSVPALSTEAYSSPPGARLRFANFVLATLSNDSSPVAYLPGAYAAVGFQDVQGLATLMLSNGVGGTSRSFPSVVAGYIEIEKVGWTLAALSISILHMTIQGDTDWDNLGVVTLGFGAALPGLVVISYYLPPEWGRPWKRRNL